ncbi:hypothetical protein VTN00DRAFT_4013 [Thermoascus crustaceus]|uniref:uncharacterized protein n=1 Tax=Thermoascus crustaceus TaxID=5088 RepID=UPI0037437891
MLPQGYDTPNAKLSPAILDEPTSSLDNRTAEKRLESVGKLKLVIAHRLSTIRNADKILVIENGRIIGQGTNDELMVIEKGYYRDLYLTETASNLKKSGLPTPHEASG